MEQLDRLAAVVEGLADVVEQLTRDVARGHACLVALAKVRAELSSLRADLAAGRISAPEGRS